MFRHIRLRPTLHAVMATLVLMVLYDATVSLVLAQQAGGIPTPALPQEAAGDQNNILQAWWGWMRFVLQILAIVLGTAIFLITVTVTARKFVDINDRNGTLGDVVPVIGVGLVFLVLSGLLLTIGWSVITNTSLSL